MILDEAIRLHCVLTSGTTGICASNRNYLFNVANFATMSPGLTNMGAAATSWSATDGPTLAATTKYKGEPKLGATTWTIVVLFKAPTTVSNLVLFKMIEGTTATTNFEIKLTDTTTITITVEDAIHIKNNVTALGTTWHHLACKFTSGAASCRLDGAAAAFTTTGAFH